MRGVAAKVRTIPRPDRFRQFAAIDWSGAKGDRHRGIAVATCDHGSMAPTLVVPPAGIWSRRAVLGWLLDQAETPILLGIDFSFSAPFVERGAHLPGEPASADARALWAQVDAACTDADLGAASFLEARRGTHFYFGKADGAKAGFLHYRTCERAGKPSTVYDAIGAAQVAKGSFAGMRLLHHLGGDVAIWPFDPVPDKGATIVEIYTAIAARAAGLPKGRSKIRDAAALDAALAALGSEPHAPLARYDDHATDAILTAAWLRANAARDDLWAPEAMTPTVARTEGWTFGVT
jgi:hypothetical protein